MEIALLTGDKNCKSVVELSTLLDCISIYSSHIVIPNTTDVVFVLNYQHIIPKKYFNKFKFGMIIIHSSDLPKGRGWAPIYNSIHNGDTEYVLTALKIDEKVDRGDILMKLRINKPIYISNNNLREIDESGTVLLINELIRWLKKTPFLCGKPQNEGEASYNKKRTLIDNKLDLTHSIGDVLLDVLATNQDYPAFIEMNGEKIFISAVSEKYYYLNDLKYSLENFLAYP